MLRSQLFPSLTLALALAAGCSQSVTPVVNAPIGSDVQLRKDLEVIAESGSGDSALQPIEMGVQALDASFPKREDLAKSKAKLLKSPTPEKRKEVAREMLQILDSAKQG